MQVEFPRLADTLVEGVVSAWYKRPGENVRKGEPLFAVETDKVNTDVESPYTGVLAEILVAEGEHAEVGQVLARVTAPGESAASGATSAPMTPATPPSAPPVASANGLSPIRRRIAERMTEARATIAQGSCARLVDLRGIDRHGVTWTAFFVRALARALDADRIGVAIEIPDGLVVPVVPDARDASLHDLGVRIADLGQRARSGTLTALDVGGAAASVTNVGATGTLLAFPLVAPGEPLILAPGAIVEGSCWLALCYDRAKLDEYEADRLLGRVVAELTGA
ncbi:MAG TPA: 2-oxo acid dehydrogenase subunit E2 [Candidatus Sulfotelmatobacter sp.]|nr:2-oxo acid dehydrogenase subunit E2 [Candidatus Sulfotelmatobacter sp.]